MGGSRVKNTMRNSAVGILSYACSSILAFACRAVFVHTLGVEYLGVSGLYTNILSVLALSDLGIYTAMVYSLYKPIAEGDVNRIAMLIRYYQKLYAIVATVITVLGLCCVPFLRFLVKDTTLAQKELIIYYLLILANSICSYFAIAKSTLIRADQNASIIQGVQAVSNIIMHLMQIVFLICFKNYVLYLAIAIASTLLNNIVLSRIADKKYPYLKSNTRIEVDKQISRNIQANFKATFLYKLGNTIMNSTDNILISVILGTVVVGYYNNYFTVVSVVNGILMILINSVLASIGNYNATQSDEEKFSLFKIMLMIFYAMAGFCMASYFAIFNDFITVWLGSEYVLDDLFLIVLVFNFTISCISNPIWMTREASGVFESVRYVMLIASIFNIILSIIFGKLIGLSGIILATAVSKLLTLFWYEPKMLCKLVFHNSVCEYWKKIITYSFAMLPCAAVGWILHGFHTTNILIMTLKVVLCGIITGLSFILFFIKTREMKRIINIFLNFFNRFKVTEEK